MQKLTVLDLFSGIGGFSLGLESTGGFKTIQFCEIHPFGRSVLAHHWPRVPIHGDIKTLARSGGFADVITGGFPCQDISVAGRGAGLDGAKSSLWWEMYRIIGEVRPSWVIIENSPALRRRGLDQILRALAEIGYDAEWHCVPASAVGAPHRRDRLWIIAYPAGQGLSERSTFADADSKQSPLARDGWWSTEPTVVRMVHGVPRHLAGWRKAAVMALGNSVVPQIVAVMGRAILESRKGYMGICEQLDWKRLGRMDMRG